MKYYVVVHIETGEILLDGQRIYHTYQSANKAYGYFVKRSPEWKVTVLSAEAIRLLLQVQSDGQVL